MTRGESRRGNGWRRTLIRVWTSSPGRVGLPQAGAAPWGRDADQLSELIFHDEFDRAGVTLPDNQIGIGWAGSTILAGGTQQARYLPSILDGSAYWCQLFSEPEAGSDLASLRIRAVRDGDTYVIDGQKVWSIWAERSDYGILLARTVCFSTSRRQVTPRCRRVRHIDGRLIAVTTLSCRLSGSDRKMPVHVNQPVAQPFCVPTILTYVRYALKAVGCQPLSFVVRHSKQTALVRRVGLHIRSAASGSVSKALVAHCTERVVSPSAASAGVSGWPRSPGRPPLARNTIFSPGPRVPSWISLMRPARARAV
jgi:hypothetical protein